MTYLGQRGEEKREIEEDEGANEDERQRSEFRVWPVCSNRFSF